MRNLAASLTPRVGEVFALVVRGKLNKQIAHELGTTVRARKITHRGIWVEPSLLAEIEYRAKSAEGKVRHPFFKGIREDL
jgi:FixJ family two-component response regulator